jgi:hypothetical protein
MSPGTTTAILPPREACIREMSIPVKAPSEFSISSGNFPAFIAPRAFSMKGERLILCLSAGNDKVFTVIYRLL